jgi:uncharacterized protein (TIGR03435 family)
MRMTVVACAVLAFGPQLDAQTPTARETFEVASVKTDPHCTPPRNGAFPPGRLTVSCITLMNLIKVAYGTNGAVPNPRIEIIGGPAWLGSDTFAIDAKAESNAGLSHIYGRMLRALLEDRFGLKTHTEARMTPVYILTVAKSGPKMQPTKEGSCMALDRDHVVGPQEPGKPTVPPCGASSVRPLNGNLVVDAHGVTMASLATGRVYGRFDRPVVDQTGLTGIFEIHLEAGPTVPAASPTVDGVVPATPAGPDIFTAIQTQLGLKLERGSAPVEVLVVDSGKQPSEN